MTIDPPSMRPPTDGPTGETTFARFPGAAVVQVVHGQPDDPDSMVVELQPAEVTVTNRRVVADVGDDVWAWHLDDLEAIVHASNGTWSIMVVPDIPDFGVTVPADRVAEFRGLFDGMHRVHVRHQRAAIAAPVSMPEAGWPSAVQFAPPPPTLIAPITVTNEPGSLPLTDELVFGAPPPPNGAFVVQPDLGFDTVPRRTAPGPLAPASVGGETPGRRGRRSQAMSMADLTPPNQALAGIDARNISAWFGSRLVLDRVSLTMEPGRVTALIGPSGCGKSTFLRILNRMHEMIPGAQMGGQVLVDGHDIYDPERKLTDARREVGMVFQKPNPFPAMSIYDNVLASFRLTGVKASPSLKDEIVESCLTKAGLWNEVKDRLRQPGGGLSGGQQQRLCIARALALTPRVLLMDEPCSALDPTSTRRIEETIMQIVSEVTIVIVTHNMQQANRVSDHCAFFLAEQGTPGVIVEHGPTNLMFEDPQDPRTFDYVNGRFG